MKSTPWYFSAILILCLAAMTVVSYGQDGKGGGRGGRGDGGPSVTVSMRWDDGIEIMSVNGGPGAVIDHTNGLILKNVGGQPAVIDKMSGMMMIESADGGEPKIVDLRAKGMWGGDAAKAKAKAMAAAKMKSAGKKKGGFDKSKMKEGVKGFNRADSEERMKNFMQSAKSRREDAANKTAQSLEARLAALKKLLGVSDEEWAVLLPLLRAVLVKQDEIRRSLATPVSLSASKKRVKGVATLPAAVRDFHKLLLEKKVENSTSLKRKLSNFRSAREKQDKDLKTLRDNLRTVLTLLQEAKLASRGVLD